MEESVIAMNEKETQREKRAQGKMVLSPWARCTKRTLDVVASIVGMIVFSPLILIVYLAVRMEDGGDAIFSQTRVGYRGKDFTLYKFR